MEASLTRYGPYTLVKRLGAGGMAEAFLATKEGLAGAHRKLVVKLILPEVAEDPLLAQSFLDESKIHSNLHHPGIVELYDSGVWPDGRFFMAMEYVEGVDLRKLERTLQFANMRLPPELVLEIGYRLASALEHAHSQQVVHRDLSPHNVFLSLQGTTKLGDFGIALAQSRLTKTNTGTLKGKLSYMSPEQFYGHLVDGRTDLFALGLVLGGLYAGRHPYRLREDDTEMAIAVRIGRDERKAIKELAPHAPDSHCEIIERLLEVDASRRIPDATTLINLLAPLLSATATRRLIPYVKAARDNSGFPDSVRSEPSGGSPAASPSVQSVGQAAARRPMSRASVRLGVVAGAVLLAALFGVWSGSDTHSDPPARAPLIPSATTIDPEAEHSSAQQPSPNEDWRATPPAVPAPLDTPGPARDAANTAAQSPAEPLPASGKTDSPIDVGSVVAPTQAPSTPKGAATLGVVVVPFGDIEVDGHRMTEPAVELPPGTHHIRAGRTEALLHRRSVRLKAGERKEIIIELGDNE